jgi:hypothetical protein
MTGKTRPGEASGRNQAIALKIPGRGMMSVMGIYRQPSF